MFKRTMMSRLESGCSFIGSLVPKVFCTGTLTWSLWVVLTVANDQVRNQYERPTLASVFDAIAIFLYLLCVFTYYKIIVCGPGSPLDYKELIIENIYEYTSSNPYDSISQQSPLDNPPVDIITMHNFGRKGYRYCPKCAVWKPDRAHHCSRENKCILRMDHHCPWFSICIGYFNQKFFVQFLCYIAIYAGLVLLETTVLLYEFFSKDFYAQRFLPISLVILFIIALAFAVAVSAFAGFLIYLVLLNLTTIEFQERSWNRSNNATNGSFQYQFDEAGKKAGNIYDLGYARNWRSIMGPNWLHWILPITLTNKSVHAKYLNGINYEVDAEVYEKWCYNARLQDQLNQQLAEYNLNRAER